MMTTSSRRYERTIWLVADAAVAGLIVILLIGLLAWRVNTNLGCVKTWASAYADRSQALTALSNARENASDVLFRDIGQKPQNPAKEAKDYAAYLVVSDAYNKAQAAHPLPSPPYNCSIF